MTATRFQWTVSYQGETEFEARLESGRTVTLALRWRASGRGEDAAPVGIVRDYRDSRRPITPELFEEFRAHYATLTHYPAIELSRGHYAPGAGWIKVA